jgi:hypothetical protein
MKKLFPIFALAIFLPSIVQATIIPAQLINLANQDRAASHIAPLKENPTLTKELDDYTAEARTALAAKQMRGAGIKHTQVSG